MTDRSRKRIAVFLINPDSPHQQHLKAVAVGAAARLRAEVVVHFAGSESAGSSVIQIRQVHEILSDKGSRFDAVIVHPVSGPGSERIVQNLARAGLPCLIINRSFEGLQALRQEFPKVLFCCISPDQVEVGRIQGRQFLRLHEDTGLVLYVQGPLLATAVQQRLTGMREVLRSSKLREGLVSGDWLASKAAAAVDAWFSANAAESPLPSIIGCQNDAMALGAYEALERLATKRADPSLKRIPVTGCDGAPDYGALFVRQGKLAATVELEDPMEAAFGVLERYFNRGEMPPLEIRLAARSLPELTVLKAVSQG
jgi:ABC-type sugar transport system substrate-binding protein